ncbi:MAG TPA: hypothetical protein VJL28_01530 [Gemmatimonadaceae bacterium]|nr:hypothetical protein [Gemmatimonadaceae bacterium]
MLVAGAGYLPLAVGDFRSREVEPVGREGDGPGEYREVTRIHALGGDSTLVEDRRRLRWIILDGSRAVATLATWAQGARGPTVAAVDGRGRVLELRASRYGEAAGVPVMQYAANAESLLVLIHRDVIAAMSGRAARSEPDTVARLRGRFRGLRVARRGTYRDAPLFFELHNPLGVEEQAMLFPDGWLALALFDPYRVDWITPEGRRLAGRPLPFTPTIVDDRQMRHAIVMWGPGGRQSVFGPTDFPNWPDNLPPFHNDALVAAPDGRLLIQRTSNALEPFTLYDIVDRAGELNGRLKLAANERIIGFGVRSVYVLVITDDDTQRLRRHPWP